MKSATLDYLTIGHFLLWATVGFFLSNQYLMVFVLSFLWELFETFCVNYPPLYKWLKNYWIIPESYWNETVENKMADLVVNMAGYVVGSKLSYYNTYII